MLFAAARDDHVRTVIQPALAQGTWVLCDRFSDSTRAYQGKVGHVQPGILNAMERVTIGDLEARSHHHPRCSRRSRPEARGRAAGGAAPDRFESEDLKFHQDLRDAYREIAGAEPARCVLIDASGDANTVAASVWTALRDRFFSTAAASPA